MAYSEIGQQGHSRPGATLIVIVLFCLAGSGWNLAAKDEFEIGGPLAGLKLPLFPTQHGEEPGHPGCLPGTYANEGLAPERLLYPASVEHYRAYMFKYMPIRSFFDRQSLLKNWNTEALTRASGTQPENYASPVYWVPRHKAVVNTGRKLAPVPVIRCKPLSPVCKLDLGQLPPGLYAIRVIGAVGTAKLRPFRLPLYLALRINDGPTGKTRTYRVRVGYCDEFYSVAEIYFHAPEKRAYRAELFVDRGSQVDLLIHNVTLDDVLAGTERRAIKQKMMLHRPPAPTIRKQSMTREQRLDRDRLLWNLFPPVNAQGCGGKYARAASHVHFPTDVTFGAEGKSAEEIEKEFGLWQAPPVLKRAVFTHDTTLGDFFLVNEKLHLKYTLADLRAHRPLPDPYPFKADGAGLFTPSPTNPGAGQVWDPIAIEVGMRIRDYPSAIERLAKLWMDRGDRDAARDAALALIRFSYAFPALDPANYFSSLARDPGAYGRDLRCRRRITAAFFFRHYAIYLIPNLIYDQLFPVIKDNQELADSVHRFVPWVKTPEDLVELLDVYLVQTTAKRILRYHYHTDPMVISQLSAILGDFDLTDPWMRWLFARTFIYPLPTAGIQDAMITGTGRDGCEYVGSAYYGSGEQAARVAEALQKYLRAGGKKKYDLSDFQKYPKPIAHCNWQLNLMTAGLDFLRIGDVTGPDKRSGRMYYLLEEDCRLGWKWTRNPRFAFPLKHYFGRKGESAEEWSAIEAASAKLKRAPWLDNHSRVLPSWAGILETGHQHDDPRFRRAAYVRVGLGYGHHHHDSLDLQVVAHGQPFTIDGGQRPGYSTPGDRTTRVHNTVEVDEREFYSMSWVQALSDVPGTRYLAARAMPSGAAKLRLRQIALIDVDEGSGSRPLSPELQKADVALPKNIITPNSYVFDCFRVSGGKAHTYCFHGMINDQFVMNAQGIQSAEDAPYLQKFGLSAGHRFAGKAPEDLTATWRQKREREGHGFGSETYMLGKNFDPASPREFIRLHLLGVPGSTAYQAEAVCKKWGYQFTDLMVQQKSEEPLESAYAAIIEPYVGEPFIASARRLEIPANEADALRAVAVEVKTTNGHRDLCFADGRPEKLRQAGPLKISGQFGFYSTDSRGLRLAALTGGTRLESPLVRIKAGQRERTGKVVRVDYLKKTLWIDQAWPGHDQSRPFEIGVPEHTTAYTTARVWPDGSQTAITVQRGADYFRSRIEKIDSREATVRCRLKLSLSALPGINRHWVASNDARTAFWRADCIDSQTFKLNRVEGEPSPEVNWKAFGKEGVLRLWEYGVGDTVRQSTFIGLRRTAPGTFELQGDVDFSLSFKGKGMEVSKDGIQWQRIEGKQNGKWLSARVLANSLKVKPHLLRVLEP